MMGRKTYNMIAILGFMISLIPSVHILYVTFTTDWFNRGFFLSSLLMGIACLIFSCSILLLYEKKRK